MYIYIDESGIFSNPNNKLVSVYCIAALIIPERYQKEIFSKFSNVLRSWGITNNKIKGNKLSENQVSGVVNLLCQYDVIVKAVMIDMGLHLDWQVSGHKKLQAARLLAHITPEHKPKLVQELKDLKTRVENLSNQLYVQSVLLTELISEAIRTSTLYYCQRIPETLGQFNWVIDAKDDKLTEYENTWSTLILPFTQTIFLENPLISLSEGDYSRFERFTRPRSDFPEYLKQHLKNLSNSSDIVDANKIIQESMKFQNSEKNIGLRIVDIIVNAIRRACHGNLRLKGWCDIGKLMVQNAVGKNSMKMIVFSNNKSGSIKLNVPYKHIIKRFDKESKPMLKKEFVESIEKD